MAARSKTTKNSSLLPLAVVAALVVGGSYLFLNSKGSKVASPTSSASPKTSAEPSTVKTQTSTTQVAVQGSSAGPVGRNALRAYAGPGVGEVTLGWQRFFADGENFSVHYGVQSKSYPYAAPYIGYVSSYTVKGLTPGTKYYFSIEGIRSGNVSAGSDGEVSVTAPSSPVTVVGTTGPVGRNALMVKAGPKKGQVTLSWTRVNPDTEKYHIVYGTVPGKYAYGVLNAVSTTPGNNSYNYVVGSLNSGTRYYFAIEPQRNGQGLYIGTEASVVAQ